MSDSRITFEFHVDVSRFDLAIRRVIYRLHLQPRVAHERLCEHFRWLS